MSIAIDYRREFATRAKEARARLWAGRVIDTKPKPPEILKGSRVLYEQPIGPRVPPWLTDEFGNIQTPQSIADGELGESPGAFIRRVMREAAERFGCTTTDIISGRRTINVVMARHVCFYKAKTETTWSLPRIGQFLGGRDHTTVLHGIRRIQALIDSGRLTL